MKILVACEESQVVTKQLRLLGHEAFSCDIISQSGGHPEWHIQEDVLPLLNGSSDDFYCRTDFCTQNGDLHHLPWRWDMIIAFPPCTFMSKAGARWMYPKAGQVDPVRLKKALAAKAFFMKIANADCDYIAIENPRPLKIVGLPPPSQIIQPYEFGVPFSKATCLWLKNLPCLIPTDVLTEYYPYCPSNTGGISRGQSHNSGGALRGYDAINRSKTFYPIGKAMAEQWAGEAAENF